MKESGKSFKVPGPGEILSELNMGLQKRLRENSITPSEVQECFSRMQYTLTILYLANPELPFETDSTQVRSLERRIQELRQSKLIA